MKKFTRSIFYLLLALSISCRSLPLQKEHSWQEESQILVDSYAKDLGALYPETVSDIGYQEFDDGVTPFSSELDTSSEEFLKKWQGVLNVKLKETQHPELRTDIRILLDEVEQELKELSFKKRFGIVPFIPLSEYVFQNLKDSFSVRGSEETKRKGLVRFKKYVHGASGILPLHVGIKEYVNKSLVGSEKASKKNFWPTRYELEIYLKNSEDYLAAIKDLLSHFNEKEWHDDYIQFRQQDLLFRKFIGEFYLPFARRENKTPKEIFEFTLMKIGIDLDVDDLIQLARKDYEKTYSEFCRRGVLLAKKYKLKDKNPLSVVRFFARRIYKSKEDLLRSYEKMNHNLYQLVIKNDLITIKDQPKFVIRFANQAEVQSIPAPFFISPPLLNNKENTPGQFVITPPVGGRNDFSYPEAILTLTAHETMPGHGLQYHAMKEHGTTLMRSWLAFNNVNVEGWGLYAEDLVFPYVSEEEKFILLQRRLWRQARMFLDPELNLGRIKKERVFEVFEKELGFSKPFSQSEYDRYYYIMPGQATSYYFGYRKLIELKDKLKMKLGNEFNERCFNDAVLNLGVLPLKEIHSRLLTSLKCRDSR